jgi:hypothetical protein
MINVTLACWLLPFTCQLYSISLRSYAASRRSASMAAAQVRQVVPRCHRHAPSSWSSLTSWYELPILMQHPCTMQGLCPGSVRTSLLSLQKTPTITAAAIRGPAHALTNFALQAARSPVDHLTSRTLDSRRQAPRLPAVVRRMLPKRLVVPAGSATTHVLDSWEGDYCSLLSELVAESMMGGA